MFLGFTLLYCAPEILMRAAAYLIIKKEILGLSNNIRTQSTCGLGEQHVDSRRVIVLLEDLSAP